MSDKAASQVIEALRKGVPPLKGVRSYSVGHEKLTDGIRKFHLNCIGDRGIIRFINGSWGAGKTHFFRVLREVAFDDNCLVSNVELNVNEAALNKFETIFAAIVRNIVTPSYFTADLQTDTAPFRHVLVESLLRLGDVGGAESGLTHVHFERAVEALMSDHGIDIDFKVMVRKYWETFLPDSPDITVVEDRRGHVLQWFSGEGSIGAYRKQFGVNKIVNRQTAKLMLQSLSAFVRLSGYRGLVILFDEAEQAYSIMRKAALQDAHNNLLSLINNIEGLSGLFLIYATTPDFFNDPKHGIVIYAPLSGRIGKPQQREPRALDVVWNFDAIETKLTDYQTAARKIRCVYLSAFPDVVLPLPQDAEIDKTVEDLFRKHSSMSPIRFWRLMVAALITHFDDYVEGEVRPVDQLYDDVMDRLRED